MGSLVKCGACGERCGTRPIGTYFRWMRADGVWKHYYARICAGCAASKVLPLERDYAGTERLTCPSCGIDTDDDYDAIYVTYFAGKGPQGDADAPFCNVHAAEYRTWVLGFARDTDNDVGAPGPLRESMSASQTLRALGRDPNVGR